MHVYIEIISYQIANLCSKGFKGTCCYATSKNLMPYIKVSFSLPATHAHMSCACACIYIKEYRQCWEPCAHTTAAWHNRVKKHLMLRRLMLLCLCLCPHTLVHCASAYYYMCIRVSQFCQSDTPHPLHKEKGKEILFFPFTLFLL